MMRSGVPVVNGGHGLVLELFPPLDVLAVGVGLAGGMGTASLPAGSSTRTVTVAFPSGKCAGIWRQT